MREAAELYGVEPLITDDYLEVEAAIAELQPELVLGTQMERHIAKRLGVPCAVISAPVHVQDFPARYSPQMGFEGANVLFDTWVHPLMMGLEEHLLGDVPRATSSSTTRRRRPSHLGAGTARRASGAAERPAGRAQPSVPTPSRRAMPSAWARRTPRRSCARSRSSCAARPAATPNASPLSAASPLITVETLYDAKAHFGR